MGMRASSVAEVIFDNVRVPKENLLGEVGKGFHAAMSTLDAGRLGISAVCVGMAQDAIDQTVKYTKERVQFGKRVTIGHNAIVHGNHIRDGANIGMGAIISLFADIGEYAVVAEGAVVKKHQTIPPRVVVGGAPAKILRELEGKDISAWERSKQTYIDLAARCKAPNGLVKID